MSDKKTLKVYADRAEDYADISGDAVAKDPMWTAFVAAMPKGGHVLDLGCGPGHYAAAMARAGLKVTAFDPVPEMIALAAAQKGVKTRVAGFDDVDDRNVYDGIWANFSLLHAPRTEMPLHLDRIHTALKPSGLFHIALKTGSGEMRDKIGRLYTYYSETELTRLLEAAAFTVTGRNEGVSPGLSGEDAHWIALHAHA